MANEKKYPLVSIITLTYNYEKFISQCIESVLRQTYPYWEQIIIDDGSNDKSPEIIKKYKDQRIKYFYQEHKGINFIPETYNKALSLCNGELIAILEGDDFWPEYKIEKAVNIYNLQPDLVLIYGITVITTEGGNITKSRIPIKNFNRYYPYSFLFNKPVGSATVAMADPRILTFTFPCSVVIVKKYLEKIGGFQSIEGCPLVDYPTFLKLSLQGNFFFVPEVMGYWRRRKKSITNLYYDVIKEKIYRYIKENIEELGLHERKIEKIWQRYWFVTLYFQKGRFLLIDKKWEEARVNFLKVISKPVCSLKFLGAILGFIFSFFHLNIEFFAKLLGRPYYEE
jgi:glycosyltransferase involved in cell wall biosynthesis